METVLNPKFVRLARKAAQICAAVVFGIGWLVVFGWLLGIESWKSIITGLATMKANTAITFIFSGTALWLGLSKDPTLSRIFWIRICGGIVALSGMLTLGEYAAGINIGIDQIFFADLKTPSASFPGRMSITTALNFSLIGIGFLFMHNRRKYSFQLTQSLTLFAYAISAIALVGYLYDIQALYRVGPFASMALNTAICFFLLANAILLAQTRQGIMGLLLSESIGGRTLRRFLPVIAGVPLGLSLLVLLGEKFAIYDLRFGLAVMVILNVSFLGIALWAGSRWLNDVDKERRLAEAKLREGENRYRRFFENMHEAFLIQELIVNEAGKAVDLRLLDINPAAERVLGKTRDEIVGRTRSQLTGQPDPDAIETASRVAFTGEPAHTVLYSHSFGGWFESFTYSLGSGIVATLSLDITERKQAEEARHRSEERLTGIITSAMDAIISVDSEQSVVLFNAAAEKMFGYSASEALGEPVERFIPERYRTVHRAHINNFGETRVTNRAMNTLAVISGRRANGEEFPIEASISQIEVDGKKLYTVVLRDITDRKRAEAQIKYQADLLANVSDAIIATDEKQVITSWNRAAEKLYGWKPEEALGKLVQDLIRSEFTDAQRAKALKELTETGQSRVETLQYHRTGKSLWVEGNTIALHDDTGRLTGFVSVNRDITDRKQAEEALRRSQENFAKAFNSNPAAIAITRLTDGKFLDLNPAYTRIMQYEPREILDRTTADMNIYVRPEDRDQVVRQLREKGSLQNYELLVRVKSGETRSIVVSMEPMLYNDEECILSVFIDISERQKMEAELLRSNAELEQFAYIASHDLQEPLRAMSGMVQLLGQRYKGKLDESADEYIGHAVDASTRMQTLINDLLDYSRVGRFGKPLDGTDLENCLKNALGNLQFSIQESNTQITHDPLPTLRAVGVQLTQVLQNLVGNAIKFRSERPLHIHIGAKKLEQGWQFTVSDNGIGIEQQYFERIFLIFQRLHTRSEYPGTGIGLALCKKIIERHGGQIWVESKPEQGSTFYFTIPERGS